MRGWAYLTQAVQARERPVPPVAGQKSLLRVFPTARISTSAGVPPARVRLYRDDRETHVVDIPGNPTPIPTEVDEGDLAKSLNTEIPGHVVQPGLEVEIEIDPEGASDRRVQLGHNMSLSRAPYGRAASADPQYRYPDGSIGVWGYDFAARRLVHPSTADLMSYCGPQWISDYHFNKALAYRLEDERAPDAAIGTEQARSLLVWGGVDARNVPYLEPAFVLDAPPVLPKSGGEWRLTGRTDPGIELFSLAFAIQEIADGDGSSSFAFVIPVRDGWEGNLAAITLSGPAGSVTVDGNTNLPMAILRNPVTGQVRGFLRDPPPAAQATMDGATQAAGSGLEVLFSRGIPGAAAWRR